MPAAKGVLDLLPKRTVWMLEKRIVTACILLIIFVASVIYLPPLYFELFTGVILLLAVWEWTGLAGCKTLWGRIISAIFIISPICFVLINFLILQGYYNITLYGTISFLRYIAIFTWIFACLVVFFYPKGTVIYRSNIVGTLIGSCLLIPTYAALVFLQDAAYIRTLSVAWVLYPLVLVWVADISAYFVGSRFGRHKLAPKISKGKTWEGVAGAVLGTVLVSSLGYYFLIMKTSYYAYAHISLFLWTIFSLMLMGFSIIGDLFESVFKRLRDVKDSGNILPGHGGILDRIDSLTAALPLFMVGLMLFGG